MNLAECMESFIVSTGLNHEFLTGRIIVLNINGYEARRVVDSVTGDESQSTVHLRPFTA